MAWLLAFLIATPARPDDRQLLQANAGANADVLVILDSSHSMDNEFSDSFRLPAYMDDFLYPQGTFDVEGSKIGVAKSVLRQVMTNAVGVNWGFAYYRNPNQTFGAAATAPLGDPVGGAQIAGQLLENGGLEWMYFADSIDPSGAAISTEFDPDEYPDVQQGRFLLLGHKAMHNYAKAQPPQSTGEVADIRFPYGLPVGVPGVGGKPNPPEPGTWRGAFGPKGIGQGLVIYRNPNKAGFELRMQVVTGNYGDPDLILQVDEYGPPATPTVTPSLSATPTNTRTATATRTPTATVTSTRTATRTNTASATPTSTRTPTNTPSITVTPSNTRTPTQTFTPSNTPTRTNTLTPSNTPTRTNTFTPSNTATRTFTPSNTATRTNTATATRTFTPSNTATRTNTFTPTNTATRTFTPTNTFTPTRTLTPSNTPTRTNTFTPSNTATRTNTPTRTNTATRTFTASNTPTRTRTFTPSNTPTRTQTFTRTNTPTRTFTRTNTPIPPTNTRTFTPSNTATRTNTPLPPTNTNTRTNTPIPPTATNTATRTNTRTNTPIPPTNTPTRTATATPIPSTPTRTKTATPTPFALPLGHFPVGSVLPAIADWLSPAIRGLLAMAPPPPPIPPPATPCVGIPAGLTQHPILCGECSYDTTKMCAYIDVDGDGEPDATPFPLLDRGFDDPQADPDPTLQLRKSVQILYRRADLFDLGAGLGVYNADDVLTGNPPWGSQPANPDNDADGVIDATALTDRHNQGMFAAIFDGDVPLQRDQQFPNDAFGGISCPFPPLSVPCDVYTQDCGGIAKNIDSSPSGYNPYPVVAAPPGNANWPVVPFARDWIPSDTPSVPVIKRLLRFASSVVSYDSTATHMNEYRLEENARNVVTTAPGTPLAGALKDAYDYFVNAVFPLTDDPAINCRNYVIVLLTDGLEECFGNPCSGGPTGLGPAGDLGAVLLPESPAGARAAAHAIDPAVPVDAIPVFVVALGLNPNDPRLTCIADNSSSTTDPARKGRVFGVTNRTDLQNALQSILTFKRNENSFAAPSVPGFASGLGTDTAQIGAVVASHKNVDGTLSQWSIWSGSLKSYRLDSNGVIPVVSATTPTPGPGTPTPTPPLGSTGGFPDESTPNDSNPVDRKPVWNAARVLGFTDPVANLAPNAGATGPFAPKAPAITVWPGRKMVWSTPGSMPRTRLDFFCPSGTCSNTLITALGLNPASTSDQTKAKLTVDFLRGGMTTNGSRDEVLNQPSVAPPPPAVGPNTGEQQKYSYFYQDDTPPPGTAPQFQTDGESDPKGYSHKLGDIFHSEPLVLDPPRYFQYLSANLNNYQSFSDQHKFRRKVLFVGANDGFLHAFDLGVYDRDDGGTFDDTWDLGSGREIFAYAPSAIMSGNFPALLNLPPRPQYFVDGSMSKADVFIDPVNNGNPTPGDRLWRSVVVGGLRQGGEYVYALDVTQPDKIDAAGVKTAGKDNAPDCLDGGGGGCGPTGITNRKYPEVLWEITDASVPKMGQTWSKPTVGRIRVLDGATPKDKYVAVFGGGFDPSFRPGDAILLADQVCPPTCPARRATRGRAFYIVDVETGAILTKITAGTDSSVGTPVDFAPMPAPPAVVDFDDDGYLDLAYIGDVNGRMWRIDLSPDASASRGICNNCDTASQTVSGYEPFLLFDASTTDGSTPSTQPNAPIFQDAAVIFVNGALRPTLGIAFGTGDRAELARTNVSTQRFYYVVDSDQNSTFHEADLRDLTPGVAPGPNTGPGPTSTGFRLDFATVNEKTISSVLSTQGFLSLLTFTPDSTSPCTTNGNSFRYRFFFLNGNAGYNIGSPTGTYGDYRADQGPGVVQEVQLTTTTGTTNMIFDETHEMKPPEIIPNDLSTINQNWKEQQ